MTAELNAALAAAQKAYPPINRAKTVTVKTKDGGRFTYSYATLDAILNAVRPVLNEHGLSIVQLLEQNDGRPQIRTELRHESGQVVSSAFPLPTVPQSPQQLGSLLTYLRRYTITAMLGVAAEDDDDGQQAARTRPAQIDEPVEEERSQFEGPSPPMRLNAWLTRRGLNTPEVQRHYVSNVLGRQIESSGDLTVAEIEAVIELLQDDATTWPADEP